MLRFPNPPDLAEAKIRRLPRPEREPGLRYFAAAGFVLKHYLGAQFLDRLSDPFMRMDQRTAAGNWQFPARMVQLADLLFSLRHQPAFTEICRRMASRELDSVYGELASAGVIMKHGFAIEARPETGTLTEDFDFSVSQSKLKANVEVWTLRQPTFNADSVLRRLKDKKRQLPADAPAIIFCVFPEEWFDQVDRLYDHFDTLTERFFGGSRRINHVVFAHEEFEAIPGLGGQLSLQSYAIPHPNPRHPSPDLGAAIAAAPESHATVKAFLKRRKKPGSTQEQTEYHRWVNWLLDG